MIVGSYSAHARIFTLLAGALPLVRAILRDMPEPIYMLASLATCCRRLTTGRRRSATWRGSGEWWSEWMLGPAARRLDHSALAAFITYESRLSRDEHVGRDDAGRCSLPKAATEVLLRFAINLEQFGVPSIYAGAECVSCLAGPTNGVLDPKAWLQLQPCRHWIHADCVHTARLRAHHAAPGEVVWDGSTCALCRAPILSEFS